MNPELRDAIYRFCEAMEDGRFVLAADILEKQSYWDLHKFLRSFAVDIESTIEQCEEIGKLYERR